MKIKKEHIILIFILLFALILRSYHLGDSSMWIDEGFSSYAIKNIMSKGIPLMDSANLYSGYYAYHYPAAAFAFLFGYSTLVLRSYSVFLGLLAIIMGYLLGREFFDSKRVGLLCATLIAFSLWEIAWSRQIRSYAQLQVLFFFTLFWMHRWFKQANLKKIVIIIIGIILSIFTHPFGYSLLAIFGYVVVLKLLSEKKEFKRIILVFLDSKKRNRFIFSYKKKLFYRDLFFLIVIVVLLGFLFSKGLNILINNGILNSFILKNYWSFLSIEYKIIFFTAFLGMVLSLKKIKETSILIVSYFIPFIFLGVVVDLFHYRYLFFFFPILLLFVARVIDEAMKVDVKKYTLIAQGIILVVLLSAIFTQGFMLIPQKNVFLEARTPQPNFKGAYEFIETNASSNYTLIAANTVPALLYDKNPEYWLRYSLTGRSIDSKTDWYTNSPAITSVNELEKVFEDEGEVWVVVDQLGMNRISPTLRETIFNNTQEMWSERGNAWSAIWVYKHEK